MKSSLFTLKAYIKQVANKYYYVAIRGLAPYNQGALEHRINICKDLAIDHELNNKMIG